MGGTLCPEKAHEQLGSPVPFSMTDKPTDTPQPEKDEGRRLPPSSKDYCEPGKADTPQSVRPIDETQDRQAQDRPGGQPVRPAHGNPGGLVKFWQELRRRKVVRVAIAP